MDTRENKENKNIINMATNRRTIKDMSFTDSQEVSFFVKDNFLIYTYLMTERFSNVLYLIAGNIENHRVLKDALKEVSIKVLNSFDSLFWVDSDTSKESCLRGVLYNLMKIRSLLNVALTEHLIDSGAHKIIVSKLEEFQEKIEEEIVKPNEIELSSEIFKIDNFEDVFKENNTEKEIQKDKLSNKMSHEEHKGHSKGHNSKVIKDTLKDKPSKSGSSMRRRLKIIEFLENEGSSSVSDISNAFSDISNKTLQRDLRALVKDNKVLKKGKKRWTRYSIRG